MRKSSVAVVTLALVSSLLFSVPTRAAMLINGAGSTFIYPLLSKMFSEYQSVDPDVQVNYQSIGSGGGIRQFMDKTVDFGASDAPMTDEQMAKSAIPTVHIPVALGAVVVTYNLPGISDGLKLTPDVVADLFLRKITQWNDVRIAKLNPGLSLPDMPIFVAHRSDGSGTTNVFTDYLSKVSPEWKSKVGTGTSVNWPVGLGGKGNEGVTGLVKQTPGGLGYVELIYAAKNNLPQAMIQNKAGSYVSADLKSVTAAAAGAMKVMPADFRISITNAEGKMAYPISGFTYLLISQSMSPPKGEKIVKLLKWVVTDGQKLTEPLLYAPLPKELAKKVLAKVGTIQIQ